MVTHHSARFGDHRHFGGGDFLLLVVEGKISHAIACFPITIFLKRMVCHVRTYKISQLK